jgi:hypothetical protein
MCFGIIASSVHRIINARINGNIVAENPGRK